MLYAGREADADALIARVEALLAAAADDNASGSAEPRPRSVELVIVARVHQMRAIAAAHKKDAEGELAEQRAALAAFEKAGDQRNATLTRANMGYAIAQLGMYEAAEELLERAPPRIASASRPSGRWRCTTSGSSTRTSGASTRPRMSSSAPSTRSRARQILGSRARPRVYLARILLASGEHRRRRAGGAGCVRGDVGARRVAGRRARGPGPRPAGARRPRRRARGGARHRGAPRPARDRRVGELRADHHRRGARRRRRASACPRRPRSALASLAVRAARLREAATIASLPRSNPRACSRGRARRVAGASSSRPRFEREPWRDPPRRDARRRRPKSSP